MLQCRCSSPGNKLNIIPPVLIVLPHSKRCSTKVPLGVGLGIMHLCSHKFCAMSFKRGNTICDRIMFDFYLGLPQIVMPIIHPFVVAGLHFWQVVFSRGGQTGCFVLQDERKSQQSTTNPTATQHIRVLLFLVQNCLVKVGKIHCGVAISIKWIYSFGCLFTIT